MKLTFFRPLFVIGLLTVALNSAAAVTMPSCAKIAHLNESESSRLLTIVIDQTTVADKNLIQKFIKIATDAIQPSTEISIYTFSAFSQNEYFTRVFNGTMETPLTTEKRYTLPKRALKVFDRCLEQKRPALIYQVQTHIKKEMENARTDLAKSDIMYSLGQVAQDMKHSKANQKYLLLFSDMLENSSVTSFYYKNKVRNIDIQDVMPLVQKAGMLTDFDGAKVYVMGAGILSQAGQKRGAYRDPKTLRSLNLFWEDWFTQSNAKLIEFGMPELRSGIE